MADNALYYGDNLDILRRYVKDETVDLVYLDPPFKSDATYNVLFGEQDGTQAAAQIKAFEDTWRWDAAAAAAYQDTVEMGGQVSRAMQAFRTVLGESTLLAYLAMMAPRLVELRRVMKLTASIYLHCDPTASHYLKMLMDAIFRPENFRNEIIWRRTNAHNSTTKQYGPIHDVVLFYTKTDNFTFHPGTRPYTTKYITDRFKHLDEHGRYQTNYLTGPGVRNGESGAAWHGYDPTAVGRHWAVPRSLRIFIPDAGKGMSSHKQLDCLYNQGFIVFPKKDGGQPMYKQYIGSGVTYQDIWAYQPNTNGVLWESVECIDEDVKYLEDESEKLGYPTQKPVGLLSRIITSSSDPGAVVLDPFCGCGTAIHTAQILNRSWIGIDITHLAVTLMKHRLWDAFGKDLPFEVLGEPVSLPDAQALADSDPYQFQWWALGLVGARPVEGKKGADKGIDGRLYFHDEGAGGKTKQVIFSVKAGHTNVTHLRDLRGVLDREGAEIGVLLTMEDPTKPMRTEAASAGFYESAWGSRHSRLQVLTVAELLDGRKIDMPATHGNVTFKKAERVKKVEKKAHAELPME